MRDVPIKFRGISIITGKYVYGWAFKQDCPMSSFPAIIDDDDKYNEVYPDSVAQLIGYDEDGNEVYEGDKLKIGDEIVTVNWNNDTTCFSVKWKNGLEDSFGTVRYHYDSKPYLVKEKTDE